MNLFKENRSVYRNGEAPSGSAGKRPDNIPPRDDTPSDTNSGYTKGELAALMQGGSKNVEAYNQFHGIEQKPDLSNPEDYKEKLEAAYNSFNNINRTIQTPELKALLDSFEQGLSTLQEDRLDKVGLTKLLEDLTRIEALLDNVRTSPEKALEQFSNDFASVGAKLGRFKAQLQKEGKRLAYHGVLSRELASIQAAHGKLIGQRKINSRDILHLYAKLHKLDAALTEVLDVEAKSPKAKPKSKPVRRGRKPAAAPAPTEPVAPKRVRRGRKPEPAPIPEETQRRRTPEDNEVTDKSKEGLIKALKEFAANIPGVDVDTSWSKGDYKMTFEMEVPLRGGGSKQVDVRGEIVLQPGKGYLVKVDLPYKITESGNRIRQDEDDYFSIESDTPAGVYQTLQAAIRNNVRRGVAEENG
jgi:hypothetical protein